MKYELSHDAIAKLIFEKASTEAQTRRKVERYIREHHEAFLARGARMDQDDIDFVSPYLNQVNISTAAEAFVEAERKRLVRARRRRRALAAAISLILLSVTALSVYYAAENQRNFELSQKAQKKTEAAAWEAHLSDSTAQLRAKEARASDSLAQLQTDTARLERDNASLQALLADQAKRRAEAQTREAEALRLNTTARTLARDKTLQALQLVTIAYQKTRNNTPQEVSQTLAEKFYSQLGSKEQVPLRFPYRNIRAEAKIPNKQKTSPGKKFSALQEEFPALSDSLLPEEKFVHWSSTSKGDYVISYFSTDTEVGGSYRHYTYKLRDTTGTCLAVWEGTSLLRNSIHITSDGKYLLAEKGGNRHDILIWNIEGESEKIIQRESVTDNGFSLSKDEKYILPFSRKTIHPVYNLLGQRVVDVPGLKKYVCFSSNLQQTNEADEDFFFKIEPHLMRVYPEVLSGIFSPDGKEIILGYKDSTVQSWMLEGQQRQEFAGHQDKVVLLNTSPNGQYILAISSGGAGKLWTHQGQLVREISNHQLMKNTIQFSPDSRELLTSSKDTVFLESIQGNRKLTLEGHKSTIISAEFSPDGQYLLTADKQGTVNLWHKNGKLVKRLQVKAKFSEVQASFIPKTQSFFTWGYSDVEKRWDYQGNLIKNYGGIWGKVSFPNEKYVLENANGDLKIRTLHGKEKVSIQANKSALDINEVSPTGKYILTYSHLGEKRYTVKIWTPEGKLIAAMPHDSKLVTAVFSPDEQYVLTILEKGGARLWPMPERIYTYLMEEIELPELTPNEKEIYRVE